MSLIGGESSFFGLDIGTNAVRLVQLKGSPERYNLVAFGSAPVPAGLSMSDSAIDLQNLAKIIKDLVKKTEIQTNNVVSAIPGTSVFNAVVKMPAMSQAELTKAIKYQAEQSIPLKLDEVKYDWQVIRQNPATKELTVMIIAAAKSKVEKIMSMLEMAELNVLALETATVGMSRSLLNENDPLSLILDIGSTTTEIAVVEKGVLSQTRSFPLGGYAMTRAISQHLSLEIDQAEQFKQKFGLSQDKLEGQIFKIIEPLVKNILDEAIRSTKFYQEQSGQTVQRVILTGGASKMPGLAEYIKNYLGSEVAFGNPWSKVAYEPTFQEKLNQVAAEFGTAAGLAMRE